MKKFVYIFLAMFTIIGCLFTSSCKSLNAMPDINLLKHEQTGDVQAVKTGDIAPIKGQVTASATAESQGNVGQGNTTSKTDTKVGGNLTNDSEIMKMYIEALKANSKEQGKLYQKVIMGLIAQMGILISLLGWCLKFLLKADERRDIREEKKETKNV